MATRKQKITTAIDNLLDEYNNVVAGGNAEDLGRLQQLGQLIQQLKALESEEDVPFEVEEHLRAI